MSEPKSAATMRGLLERQRKSFQAEGPVAVATRTDRIQRAINLLVDHEGALCEAMSTDFGYRPRIMSRMTDVVPALRALKYARDNVSGWMKNEERTLSDLYKGLGARGYVQYQPKGVVGNIAPWNAPVNATFSPLGGMLAAGNRVMIKPSEHAPATASLMRDAIAEYFDTSEVVVVTGGQEVAREFARLPFDHLLYTGSIAVGKLVMAAAAENLVPLTLELGGKSPVIVGRSADFERAAERIVLGKLLNAGQICLSPDYLLVPTERRDALVASMQKSARHSYPTFQDNPDYCAIINEQHRSRLDAMVADARLHGGEVIEIDRPRADANAIKRGLTLILAPNDRMQVMREEIFGPILPIVAYEHVEEAVSYVNSRPRPLGLYYFGSDPGEEEFVLSQTISGGATVNDVMQHVAHEQLPFGGVGTSGMGAYHGLDGYRTFSHARTVYRQTSADLAGMAGTRPPYGATLEKTLGSAITR